MRGINRVTLIGRLGRDPELRTGVSTGRKVATLSVATNRAFKRGDSWQEETDWHKVKCFDRLAEQVVKGVGKGDPVGITGTLMYDRWTDASGNPRVMAVIRAEQVEFIQPRTLGKKAASANPEAVALAG